MLLIELSHSFCVCCAAGKLHAVVGGHWACSMVSSYMCMTAFCLDCSCTAAPVRCKCMASNVFCQDKGAVHCVYSKRTATDVMKLNLVCIYWEVQTFCQIMVCSVPVLLVFWGFA